MAKPRVESYIFEIRATETRKPYRDRRIRISAKATLQQLHLALLAAFDYPRAYTSADRDFRFAGKGSSYVYEADALRALHELFEEGASGTYLCAGAGLRARFGVSAELPREKRIRYPLVYEEGDASPHRLCSSNAQFGAGYRYLKTEPRPDSRAFRHGIYAAIVAGPLIPPGAYLKWILPDEGSESLPAFNALLSELMTEQNAVAEALLSDPDAYVAEFKRRFSTRDALLDWTFGFVFAMSLGDEEWQSALSSGDVWLQSFTPIAALLDLADNPLHWTWLDDPALPPEMAEGAAMSTVILWNLSRKRLAPQPFMRDGPKPGQNEACPCGSGKKYKRCCGSPLRAVP